VVIVCTHSVRIVKENFSIDWAFSIEIAYNAGMKGTIDPDKVGHAPTYKGVEQERRERRAARKDPADIPLTPLQQRFARLMSMPEYAQDPARAAREAGSKSKDSRQAASRLMSLPQVRAEIDRQIQARAAVSSVTVDAVLRRLSVIGDAALAAGQYAPAVRAAELHGKYLKMFTDRVEHVQTIEDVSTDDLIALLRELIEHSDIDIHSLLALPGAAPGAVSDPAGAQTTH